MASKYRHPFLAKVFGEWAWCRFCERIYPVEKWIHNKWDCPGDDCRGSALHIHNWADDDWPRNLHPEYAERPVEGEAYPFI
jgi:hypothetical protein